MEALLKMYKGSGHTRYIERNTQADHSGDADTHVTEAALHNTRRTNVTDA